jgi:nucleoside-diphosphate-sugar epimerase
MTRPGQPRAVVLGGSRMLGRNVVAQAVAAGWEVTVLNRGSTPPGGFPPGVAHVRADRADRVAMQSLAASEPDVVVDLSSYEPEHVEVAFDAFAGRCGSYLLMSSGSVYVPQPMLPWGEDVPIGPTALWGEYGRKKVENEQLAQRWADRVPITVLRPPYILGAGDHMRRLEFILQRLTAGATVFLPDTGTACIQFAAATDVAAACIHLASARPSDALSAFNVAPLEFTTLAGLVELVAAAVDAEPSVELVPLTSVGLSKAPFSWADMVFPFADSHFVLDGRRLETTGFRYRASLRALIGQATERFRSEPGDQPLERYPSELKALDRIGQTA